REARRPAAAQLGRRDRGLPVLGRQRLLEPHAAKESSRLDGFYAILSLGPPRRLVPAGLQTTTEEVGSSVKRVIRSKWWMGLIAAGGALGGLRASAGTRIGVVDRHRLFEDAT